MAAPRLLNLACTCRIRPKASQRDRFQGSCSDLYLLVLAYRRKSEALLTTYCIMFFVGVASHRNCYLIRVRSWLEYKPTAHYQSHMGGLHSCQAPQQIRATRGRLVRALHKQRSWFTTYIRTYILVNYIYICLLAILLLLLFFILYLFCSYHYCYIDR